MKRLVDKIIVFACCCMAVFFMPYSTVIIVGALLMITVTALFEALHEHNRIFVVLPLAFVVASVFIPTFAMFTPLAAYDCFREDSWWLRLIWILALPFSLIHWSAPGVVIICLACAVACLLSWRTSSVALERDEYRRMRDGVRETSLALEEKNRDLQAASDLQVRLATLSERSRIAREIHDNVGHLLTRAIMQVEALQVVHADEPRTKADFADVGATLHAAMDEVRASVHDLRDDSLDVHEQMEEALAGYGTLQTHLDFEVEDIPANIGYCFLAVVREALSNTARHSNATSVEVAVVEHPGLYQLSIRDNGSQPAKTSADKTRGMGLSSMEDRVRALGGTFRTEYHEGFRVLAAIPKETEHTS